MILRVKNLEKSYRQGERSIPVLRGLNMELAEGSTLAIQGPSGTGKSTLLALLAGLDRPDRGNIFFADEDLGELSEERLTRLRAGKIGIVFQQFHLLPHLSALENVELALDISGQQGEMERAKELLKKVGLSHRTSHLPHQLSGGECQRVAIARGMVHKPRLLLADEPGGSLDWENAQEVMDLLFSLVKEEKMSMVLVTHNPILAAKCHCVLEMESGKLRAL